MFNLFTEYRNLVMDEKDVITILSIVNKHLPIRVNYRISNCRWADEPKKWFIDFCATDLRYGRIIKDINKIGKVYLVESPNCAVVYNCIKIGS